MSNLLQKLNMGHVPVVRLPKPPPVPAAVRAVLSQSTLDKALAILFGRFVPFQSLTAARRDEIMTYPQHFANGDTNPLWLSARENLATGSRLAAMIGWSPFGNEESTLMDMLWRKFKGNVATRWGTEHESDAQNATEAYYQSLNGFPNPACVHEIQVSAVVKEVGLVRSIAFPFAGMSPDGILIREFKDTRTCAIRVQRQLLEFKCPYKRRDLNDYWPAFDLYDKARVPHVPGSPVNSLQQPVPQYYYTQLMWGGLIMGHHTLRSILANPVVPTPHLNAFMGQCDTLPTMCGANLIDTEHPILFIVWAPCAHICHTIDTPECYHEEPAACSKWIRTRHGAIQLTEVEYNPAFATWMTEAVYDFWRNKYMPPFVKKAHGVLLRGELDVPVSLHSDSENEDAD